MKKTEGHHAWIVGVVEEGIFYILIFYGLLRSRTTMA